MFQIPFVLWLSEAFKKQRPGLAERLPNYLQRRFMTDDLIHTLPDLLGFSFTTHNPGRSLFREEWTFRSRIIVDGERKIDRRDYDTDIAVIADDLTYRRDLMARQDRTFREKVWAHECNTIGKLREAQQIFSGVELDLVFDEKQMVFDVNHPPTPSIGLQLADALAALENPAALKYWFDIKNLTPENAAPMCAALETVCDQFALVRANLIIESMVAQGLGPFRQAGFRTSYYLPTPFLRKLARQSFRRISSRDRAEIDNINRQFGDARAWAVSVDGYLVEFVARFMPTAKHVLAWYQDKSPYDHFRRIEMRDLLDREKRLAVLLVKHPSRHDRR